MIFQKVKKLSHFWEQDSSSSWSQKLATFLCSESDVSSWIQPIFPHPISLRCILILWSHVFLGFPQAAAFLQTSASKPREHFSSPSRVSYTSLSHSPWFNHSNDTFASIKNFETSVVIFSPFSCYFLLLGPKDLPCHPILKHTQPVFFR